MTTDTGQIICRRSSFSWKQVRSVFWGGREISFFNVNQGEVAAFFFFFPFVFEKVKDLFFSSLGIETTAVGYWCRTRNLHVFFYFRIYMTCPRSLRNTANKLLYFKVVIQYRYIISVLTFLFSDVINDMYILTFSSNGHMYLCGPSGERFFLDSPIYRIFILFYCVVPCF